MRSRSRAVLLTLLGAIATSLGSSAETPPAEAAIESERRDEVAEIVANSRTSDRRGLQLGLDREADMDWLHTPALSDPVRSPLTPVFEPVPPPAAPAFDFD